MSYAALIAQDTRTADPATVALVEDLMRSERSTLDGLSRDEFTRLARRSYRDARAWASCGAVDGITLADYCEAMGLAYPAALTS